VFWLNIFVRVSASLLFVVFIIVLSFLLIFICMFFLFCPFFSSFVLFDLYISVVNFSGCFFDNGFVVVGTESLSPISSGMLYKPMFMQGWFCDLFPNFILYVVAPVACAISWFPRQIPNVGIFLSRACFIIWIVSVSNDGSPGPFEMNSPLNFRLFLNMS